MPNYNERLRSLAEQARKKHCADAIVLETEI